MVATAIYSVTMVLWKETAFLFTEPWKGVIITISVKKLNSLKHLVRTTVAGSHN